MYNDDFRTFVLGLPETKEGQHAGLPTFLVRGRRFATLGWPDPHKIAVALSPGGAVFAADHLSACG
jgi:hypothetical protein